MNFNPLLTIKLSEYVDGIGGTVNCIRDPEGEGFLVYIRAGSFSLLLMKMCSEYAQAPIKFKTVEQAKKAMNKIINSIADDDEGVMVSTKSYEGIPGLDGMRYVVQIDFGKNIQTMVMLKEHKHEEQNQFVFVYFRSTKDVDLAIIDILMRLGCDWSPVTISEQFN